MDGLVELFLAEGFLHFSLDDLVLRLKCSKSTLYSLAPSKEQLFTLVVRAYFRRATENLDAKLAVEEEPTSRLRVYLEGIAQELAPASRAFHDDLAAFPPTSDLYARNSEWAAGNVRTLLRAAEQPGRPVDTTFAGAAAALVIEGIQQGRLRKLTGLDDADGYRALADLLLAGVAGAPERGGAG